VVPPQPVLYVENNVGLRFCRAFNEFSNNHGWGAVYQNHIHPGMQKAQHGDEWWIEDIAGKGYALLTCDLAIATTATERAAIERSAARLVGFARADYDGWQQMRAITRHWEALEPELRPEGPVIIKVYAGATAPVVERLGRRVRAG
jgi:PIN like domain